ncbi:MAG: hypothetical protein AAF346_17155, partial [Pseudomonadota bacterium]
MNSSEDRVTAPYTPYGEPRPEQVSRVFLTTMVSLTLLMNTLGRGVTETFTVFLLPVEETMGASRAEMTLA